MQTYSSYEKLKEKLLKAIEETEGFGQEWDFIIEFIYLHRLHISSYYTLALHATHFMHIQNITLYESTSPIIHSSIEFHVSKSIMLFEYNLQCIVWNANECRYYFAIRHWITVIFSLSLIPKYRTLYYSPIYLWHIVFHLFVARYIDVCIALHRFFLSIVQHQLDFHIVVSTSNHVVAHYFVLEHIDFNWKIFQHLWSHRALNHSV